MALKPRDTENPGTTSERRISLDADEVIVGVVLRTSLLNSDVKVRPTNTTAWICTVAGTGNVSDAEENAGKYILLHNGPHGGFSQGGAINYTSSAASYLVSDNIDSIITE